MCQLDVHVSQKSSLTFCHVCTVNMRLKPAAGQLILAQRPEEVEKKKMTVSAQKK